jgi:proteasome lid subunit RPN8/RPN11
MGSMSAPPAGILIAADHWEEMVSQVRASAPLEACGLIGGLDGRSLQVFPMENVDHSRVRYQLDPREQLRVFNLLDEREWDLLAIYHSHPRGPAGPSITDVAEAAYPETLHLIWSRQGSGWTCRAFRINGTQVTEVPVMKAP